MLLQKFRRMLGRGDAQTSGVQTEAGVDEASAEHVPVNYRPLDPKDIDPAVEYAVRVVGVWRDRMSKHGVEWRGRRMLELGPGIDLAPQIVLAGEAASFTVADQYLIQWQPQYHPEFYRKFREQLGEPSATLDRVIDQGSYDGVVRTIEEPAESMPSLESGSLDVVLSNAVLEHVADMPSATTEFARITAPGGAHIHQVDFRFHRSFDRPLDHLLAEADFTAEAEASGQEYGCLIRPLEMVQMFESAGLALAARHDGTLAEEAYMQEILPKLRDVGSRYASWPEDDLRAVGVLLCFRR